MASGNKDKVTSTQARCLKILVDTQDLVLYKCTLLSKSPMQLLTALLPVQYMYYAPEQYPPPQYGLHAHDNYEKYGQPLT